jgi:hypothetical protein
MTDKPDPGENLNPASRHLREPFLHFTYTVDM